MCAACADVQHGAKKEQGLVLVQEHVPKVKVGEVWGARCG